MLGLMFTAPWLLGFAVFTIYPVVASFYYSLCDYNVFDPPMFNGGHNYVELVCEDKLFWISLWNTVYFMVFAIPTTMLTALVLAMLLNLKVRGQAFYRASRWVDREPHDVAALAREGNLGVIDWLDPADREVIDELVATGESSLLSELRHQYLDGAPVAGRAGSGNPGD